MRDYKERTKSDFEFGLAPGILVKLREVFSKNEYLKYVMLFGSRATESYKDHSDIDLVVMNAISFDELLHLEVEIDELLILQEVDLLRFDSIENLALKEHIERKGKPFYKR